METYITKADGTIIAVEVPEGAGNTMSRYRNAFPPVHLEQGDRLEQYALIPLEE